VEVSKNGYIKLNMTHYYVGKFNVATSLYRVLKVTLYFSKNSLEIAIGGLVAAEVL